jgi:SPP1 family predicted phage head-tail adaptor
VIRVVVPMEIQQGRSVRPMKPLLSWELTPGMTLTLPAEVESILQSWDTFAEAWASIEPLIGKEYFAQEREQAVVSHKIRMRYQPGITHKMRVAWESRLFEIESVLNVGERNREIVLMGSESV